MYDLEARAAEINGELIYYVTSAKRNLVRPYYCCFDHNYNYKRTCLERKHKKQM